MWISNSLIQLKKFIAIINKLCNENIEMMEIKNDRQLFDLYNEGKLMQQFNIKYILFIIILSILIIKPIS